ncbi:MAG: MetQ/NlpA family ABC transporter substrate-binding protein [Lachnospiraceae bacterium]|nr:MetQ/NlpA family ABC transporter substrate-binding protein [Lachnospiraceae bacterium]
MKKKIALLLTAVLTLSFAAGCGSTKKADTSNSNSSDTKAVKVVIGASPSPHVEILEAAKSELAKKGIDLEIKTYNDYVQPNIAVDQGQIDANYFQHKPYLDDFNKENGTKVVSVGKIHYEPFGIYAGKSKDLSKISDGAKIAVPNDTTNEARALLLLQDNGVIKLKSGAGLKATKKDITENPKNVEIMEVEAAQIPRSIDSVDFACMNGNYAIQAGFKPSDAIVQEKSNSEAAETYGNIIAVSEKNKDAKWAKTLVKVLKSDKIKKFITDKYDGGVVPLN